MNSDAKKRFANCGKLKRPSTCNNTDFNYYSSNFSSQSSNSNSYHNDTDWGQNNNCHNGYHYNLHDDNNVTECYS